LIRIDDREYSQILSTRAEEATPKTFVDLLQIRSATHADRRGYVFLRDGEEEDASLTFGQVYARARAAAEELLALGAAGKRVVLLYPPGLDFVVAFFGCLMAGVVPVPVSIPNRRSGFETTGGIAVDSGASWILSSRWLLSKVGDAFALDPRIDAIPRLASDEWPQQPAGNRELPPINPADLAVLQYTSGSTGRPRGVMVSHANLFRNHGEYEASLGRDEGAVMVSWLPMFHDMGLGTVLWALWLGVPCVLMAPTAFLQQPLRWLKAISRYRATWSGGPDFAYDLCIRRIAPSEREGLDLSSWRVAFNGSEPVRAATLDRFADSFAHWGFQRESFHPVYGLAESTLFVTGDATREAPTVRWFSREALEKGSAEVTPTGVGTRLVACGRPWLGTRVSIVNPESFEICSPGTIGEIWVKGPSVAGGYWQNASATSETFEARTADGEGPFLRTGDLGFFYEGRLFVAGRHKDLIIVRGQNHYPQDIEDSASSSHAALEPQRCAAFSVDGDDGEELVVAQELSRGAPPADTEEIFRAIRSAVSEHHGLRTQAIALLAPSTLPRTSSGKIRRKACREAYLNKSLQTVAVSDLAPEGAQVAAVAGATPSSPPSEAADRLIEWLRRYPAKYGD
jgi:acyl-CoA synthetase (AMP-forming)/AMP-acid ligase II